MQLLSEALQRITPWYQDPDQDVPPTFPRGLPLEDLKNLLEYLPFQLPEEVCELYQWSNGHINPLAVDRQRQPTDFYQYDAGIGILSLISLKDAIDLWFYDNDEDEITSTWYHFPIFSHENGLIVIIGSDQMEDSSPVWDVDRLDDELREPVFPNLTNMMTGIAETIEMEQTFWDDLGHFNAEGYWEAHKLIWRKYRA